MPIYKYKGYRAGGGDAAGTIEADGLRSAARKLKEQGIFPKDVAQVEQKASSGFRRKLDTNQVPRLTRRLGVLIQSGVPVVEALRALSEESGGRIRQVLVDLKEKVGSGSTLSRALEAHTDLFPQFYRHMVEAAEESGSLDVTLGRLADFLEGQERTREKVRTAMIYPTIMAMVAFAVMLMLFTFVVPRIVQIFENREAALPLATTLLIWISNIFVNYWWLVIALLIGVVVAAKKAHKLHGARLDRMLMRVLGSLYLARFARTLGFLLEGGLPIFFREVILPEGASVMERRKIDLHGCIDFTRKQLGAPAPASENATAAVPIAAATRRRARRCGIATSSLAANAIDG